jgi:5-methylcytosine-specific restriction endonuclease McrA
MPSRRKIPTGTRQRLAQEAGYRCSYCRSPEWIGIPMLTEHITPLTLGGNYKLENLCFACYKHHRLKLMADRQNLFKQVGEHLS